MPSVRRLVNQSDKRTQALVFAAYRYAPHNAHQEVFGHAQAHLRAEGQVKIGEVIALIEFDS